MHRFACFGLYKVERIGGGGAVIFNTAYVVGVFGATG
ncbi:hypothetical protein GALL_486370 [mine drainage metagenome]|uniref:Uncharacterized protein n=1 Tax=mine drainage metagenome TaxID=410659 RepID=A0A1J5PPR8_9ZZZZ